MKNTESLGAMALRLLLSPRSASTVVLVYGGAIAFLVVGEMVVSHIVAEAEFGHYQYVRQLAPILAIAAVLGTDQGMPREFPGQTVLEWNWAPRLNRLMLWAVGIGLAAALGSFSIMDLPITAAVALAVAPPCIVGSSLSAAHMRSVGRYGKAALYQQGYRLLLGASLLLTLPVAATIAPTYPLIMACSAMIFGAAGVAYLRKAGKNAALPTRDSYRRLRRSGLAIAIATLTLGAVDWIDQATLAHSLGSFEVSGQYTALKVFLVSPFIGLVSVLGFAAMPEIAKNPAIVSPAALKRLQTVVLLSGTILAALLLLTVTLFPVLLPTDVGLPVPAALLTAGVMRLLLVVPSAILGAIGTVRYLVIYAGFGVFTVLLIGTVIAGGSMFDILPMSLAAAALVLGLSVRLTIAHVLALRALLPAAKDGA